MGPAPFGATCYPAETPAGADPQGLRARLPAIWGYGLGLAGALLGHGAWLGGVGRQGQGGWWQFLEVPVTIM